MGEKQTKPFQLSFNGSLKVDFQGSHVTSDGGLILVRELDERLGLGELIDEHLSDSRQGTNKQFTLADLLRQSIYSRLAGYEDVNDAVRVSADPTFRLIGSQKIWDRGAALTSTLHGFETEMLASEENLLGLMALNRELVGQAEAFDDSERVVLDMDSTESPVHGQQEGSAYNGHFESVCYHPLLLFNGHGDCLAAKLRPGNVHSAEDWDELLLPEIERQQAAGKQVAFRGDAAFAKPEIYEALEERGADYAIRIPANKNLELEIEDILFRPPGTLTKNGVTLTGGSIASGDAFDSSNPFDFLTGSGGSSAITGISVSTGDILRLVVSQSIGVGDYVVVDFAVAFTPSEQTVLLVIDEDSIDNGNPPNFFTDIQVNDDIAEIGLRTQLLFFAVNVGNTITLHTGQVGDEGWFALKAIPASWNLAGPTADGLRNYVGEPSEPFPHIVGPGLGTPDANGDRESLLDKILGVTPLRADGLKSLEGKQVCAVVYDSDISINYGLLNGFLVNGSLKGANLGTVAFEVKSVTALAGLEGFSSSSLPKVEIDILDAKDLCEGNLELLTDAPEPISSSEPFDVLP